MNHVQRPVIPNAWKAVCIIALILGSLGACMSTMSASSLLFSGAQADMMRRMAERDPNNGALQHQQEVMAEALRVQEKWQVANITLILGSLLSCIVLIVGAAASLARKAVGPPILIGACALRAVVDVTQVVIGFLAAKDSRELLQRAASVPNRQVAGLMTELMDFTATATLIFGVVWVALKLGFYVFAVLQARKPEIRALMS